MEVLVSSLGGDAPDAAIQAFVTDYSSKFAFPDDAAARSSLCSGILQYLTRPGLTAESKCLALEALRIVCRESSGLQPLASRDGLNQLLALAGILSVDASTENQSSSPCHNWQIPLEATKCLCNLTYNVHQAAACMVEELGTIQPLVKLLGDSEAPGDVLFYFTRFLFLVSGLHRPAMAVIREKRGLVLLVTRLLKTLHLQVVSGKIVFIEGSRVSTEDRKLATELMKVLFSTTMQTLQMNADETTAMTNFYQALRFLLVTPAFLEGEEGHSLCTQLVYVLINLPDDCGPALAPETELQATSDQVTVFEGYDVTALCRLLTILEQRLAEAAGAGFVSSKSETLIGVLSAMSRCARCCRAGRRYWFSKILAMARDVTMRPEQGDSLKARLIRLMTSANTTLSRTVADLLFVLCKENPSRFVKHTGYGNAAGLLLQNGLLGGGLADQAAAGYSSDSDTSVEPDIDPVSGKIAAPAPPLDEMTEEEKEQEAEKLMDLLDRLEKTGVVEVLMPTKK